MTSFHDPQRPHLPSGRPCWLSTPLIALPRLCLSPLPLSSNEPGAPPSWLLEVIIGNLSGSSWAILRLTETDLQKFLQDWTESPEDATIQWMGREPPISSNSFPATHSSVNPDDLGI